jgi:hypothetical protein
MGVRHNYNGAVIDRSYHVDVEQCPANAQAIVRERTVFLEFAKSFTVVRSWTQTTALNDADETAGTILMHTPRGWRQRSRHCFKIGPTLSTR